MSVSVSMLLAFAAMLVAGDVDDSRDEARDEALRAGLEFLVGVQESDGSFPTNEFGGRHRRGITSLCTLALLEGNTVSFDEAAQAALDYLSDPNRGGTMYDHGFATLALCEGALLWKDRYGEPAALAVRVIVDAQHANGSWGYEANPISPRTETCMAAIQLHALKSAVDAGIPVPQSTAENALIFLRRQFDREKREFNNEIPRNERGSHSYGATAAALAALQQWGERESERVLSGLEFLNELTLERITANLKGMAFSGYARGAFHYELTSHALALLHSRQEERLAGWLERVGILLLPQADVAGAHDGWYGRPYGTALVCLLLATEGPQRLAWMRSGKGPAPGEPNPAGWEGENVADGEPARLKPERSPTPPVASDSPSDQIEKIRQRVLELVREGKSPDELAAIIQKELGIQIAMSGSGSTGGGPPRSSAPLSNSRNSITEVDLSGLRKRLIAHMRTVRKQ